MSADDLIAQVEAAGYTARLPEPPASAAAGSGGPGVEGGADETAALRTRLLTSLALTVPVIVLAMVPALQFDAWQWLSLTLAAPVVTWGAWPFHRAAWLNLRHATATMDTLISVGVLAAFGWSLYALFSGTAGEIGMTHGFSWTAERGDGGSQVYLEVAAGVTVFILAGRYFEARAKRRSGAALQALLELGAKDVAVLRDGVETRIPVDQLAVGDRFVVRPGEKVATDGTVTDGTSAIDASLLTGEPVPVEVGPGDARHRRDGQRRWSARGGGDPRRCRHRAGPDRPARPGRPDRQGAGPAARRPRVRRVRPGRDRPRRRHARVLAHRRGHRQRDRGVHRRASRC